MPNTRPLAKKLTLRVSVNLQGRQCVGGRERDAFNTEMRPARAGAPQAVHGLALP